MAKAASEATDDLTEQAELLKRAADQFILDRDYDSARNVTYQIRESIKALSSNELIYLRALASIARAEKDDRLLLAVMVRTAELTPASVDARFYAGLKQGELGNDDLSLASYLSIPETERSSAVWNNLGVEFDHFQLPAKAVDAYSKAADGGETLAMSNLANKLFGQGFLEEASALCDKALETGDPHKNVHDLMLRLAQTREQEQQTQDQILASAKGKGDFYREVGRSLAFEDGAKQIAGKEWVENDCLLVASANEKSIDLVGSVERERNPFVGVGLLSTISGSNPFGVAAVQSPERVKHHIRYTGRFEGHVFFGKVSRKSEGQSLLGDAPSEAEVIMVLSSDLLTLRVIEAPQSEEPNF